MKGFAFKKKSPEPRGLMPPQRPNLKVQILEWAFVAFMAFNLFCLLLPEATQQRIYELESSLLGLFVVGFLFLALAVVVLYVVLWAFVSLFK